jgi:hypothetical protein
VLNRGEGSVQQGEKYDVFLMGEDLLDPQSGESLGALEVEVGKGTITNVKPKFSFLKMETGSLDSKSDYILRKSGPAPKPPSAKKAAAHKNTQPSRKSVFLN